MKHDNDQHDGNEDLHEIGQEQHERLCAYLFDELEGDERTAFEAELQASPALRAEQERMRASMDLVREFAPPAPARMSDEGRAALSAAAAQVAGGGAASGPGPLLAGGGAASASGGPGLAWYRHPGLQVAAAALVAVVAFRSLDRTLLDNGFGVTPENRVAHFDAPEATTSNKAGKGRRAGDAAGWAGKFGSERSVTTLDLNTLESAREAKGGSYRGAGDAVPPGGEPVLLDADILAGTDFRGLGNAPAGEDPSLGFFFDEGADGDLKARTQNVYGAKPTATLTEAEKASLAAIGYAGAPKSASKDRAGLEVLGYGGGAPERERSGETSVTLRFATPNGATPTGGFNANPTVGAVVQPSGGAGGGGGGTTAPSSPGTPAPATSAGVAGSTDWFLGSAEFGSLHDGQPAFGQPDGETFGLAAEPVADARPVIDVSQLGDMVAKREAIFGGDDDSQDLKKKLLEYRDLLEAELLASDDPQAVDEQLALYAELQDGVVFDAIRGRYESSYGESQELVRRARVLVDQYEGLGEVVDSLGLDRTDDADIKTAVTARIEALTATAGLASLGYVDADAEEAEVAFELTPEQSSELDVLRGYLVVAEDAEELERRRIERRVVQVEQEYERILTRCVPRPAEKPSMMYFRYWGDNGYEFPVHDALSTFAIDVDTASYTLARRYLKDGYLPERAQIRTEEFVNYFTPDLAAPTDGSVFSIGMELAPSPFGPDVATGGDHQLLRVGLRGMEIGKDERDPLALTFVVDVSGSMKEQNRLELVKHALRLLVSELKPDDQVAIITFNNDARRVLDMTSAADAAAIETALFGMSPDGGTNAEAGLRLGYEEAVLGHTPGSVNRVVFLSDGVGNIGETNENALLDDVRRAREKGIYLNTIGVGMGNHNDRFLEQLANGGDGLCNYVDGPEEAKRALVDNFTGAFQPIARDVKIQVEFDPAQVASYRLLGYENRAIADADFRNDKVDAGEVGAGHQIVALYEVVLLGANGAATEEPLAVARVRYKQPHEKLEAGQADEAAEIERGFWLSQAQGTFEGSTVGFQKSALAAQFAEFLRRSSHARGDSVSLLRFKLEELAKTTADPELVELAALVQLAQPKLEPALAAAAQQRTPLQQAADDLHAFEYSNLRTVYLGGDVDEALAAQLEVERQRLEQDLRSQLFAANGLELPTLEADGEPR